MAVALIGRKCGMTRVFTEAGASIPVTVIEVLPNIVTQLKTIEKDGYRAVQVTTGSCKAAKVAKPIAGIYAKNNVVAGRGLWEIRLIDANNDDFQVGQELKVDAYKEGDIIDVIGISKGKGFAGVVKRYNFRTQDATHGNSLSHRAPGSIGQNQTPGRVFKGKKMAGHLGMERCTVQNQNVVKVDPERNLLLVRGGIPGAPGCDVVIKPAVKAKGDK